MIGRGEGELVYLKDGSVVVIVILMAKVVVVLKRIFAHGSACE